MNSGQAVRAPRGDAALCRCRYDTVYLGSPIWLYSPAPPVWAFVENNRLDGKHVVLFNTYNSEFKSEFIESLKAQVLAQGVVSFEHKAVRCGRMTQQIAPEIVLRKIDVHWPIVGAPPLHAIKVALPRRISLLG